MSGFDRREVGYEKVRVPLEHLEFVGSTGSNNDSSFHPQATFPELMQLQQQLGGSGMGGAFAPPPSGSGSAAGGLDFSNLLGLVANCYTSGTNRNY